MNRPALDPGFDPRIADWLEDDPDHAPDAVLETVLAALPSISQRRTVRVPWRYPTMNRLVPVGSAFAVIAVVAIAGVLLLQPRSIGPGGPTTPSPDTTTSPSSSAPTLVSASPAATGSASPSIAVLPIPEFSKTFTSPRHGYSIRYPSTWTVVPATTSWTGNDGPDIGAGNMDVLSGSSVRLVVESAPLHGQTEVQWRTAYAGRNGLDGVGVCDVLPPDQPRFPIGSLSGYLDGNDCPGDGSVVAGDRFDEALGFSGGRVYLFWIQGNVDPAWFQAILATVTLEPSAAKDAP
jgi:hypothetical protein